MLIFRNFADGVIWRYRKLKEWIFDYIHGINTATGNEDYFSGTDKDSAKFAVAYEPVHQHILQEMLHHLPADVSQFTFIDLGSGKGRALFMASALKFRQIIGVEFSPELHQTAQQNLQSFLRKTGRQNIFKLLALDVTDFDLPKSDLVLFLYNPFFGDVMQNVVKKIELFISNEPYRVYILYRNPQCAELFQNSKSLDLKVNKSSYHIYQSKQTL